MWVASTLSVKGNQPFCLLDGLAIFLDKPVVQALQVHSLCINPLVFQTLEDCPKYKMLVCSASIERDRKYFPPPP